MVKGRKRRVAIDEATKMELINRIHKLRREGKVVDGKFYRLSDAAIAKEVGISPRTLYLWMDQYPKPIERARAEELKEEKVEQDWIRVKADLKDFHVKLRITAKERKVEGYFSTLKTGWLILDKKHPRSWDQQDFETLWIEPSFRPVKDRLDEKAIITDAHATALRMYMKFRGFEMLERGHWKDQKGQRKEDYLRDNDVFRVIELIQYPDVLVMWITGILCGGRYSSLKTLFYGKIREAEGFINMFETKVDQKLLRYFPDEYFKFLNMYLEQFGYKYRINDLIFPRLQEVGVFNSEVKRIGTKLMLPFPLTSHSAMKHTFVSLSSIHGISLDSISDQTGTDASTLKGWYAGEKTEKLKCDFRGEKYKRKLWYNFVVEDIIPKAITRYGEIKNNITQINGVKKDGREQP